jgi:hypothetical protein
MSAIKEPHFFAAEVREENFDPELRRGIARDTRGVREFLSGPMRRKRFSGIVADWEGYLRLFADAGNELALGEASACYLWSPTAAERIAGRIPDAKIPVMLRNPAERAFPSTCTASGWRHPVELVRTYPAQPAALLRTVLRSSSISGVRLYSEQLGRYLERFGRSVWVGLHEDFKRTPNGGVPKNLFVFGSRPFLTLYGPAASGVPSPAPELDRLA